ncbi:UDP-N-acetylmuramoyl-L-alanyl-D-glutamate--2,6-diaminopimelate ligase [Actinotignum sp. GS-2025a]|nr:UDP-N-acetylmuramoyl-L-alanyl-D-glutamate--2,6-diaminopimelate ligase [Actinotignum timonense]MDK6926975.1 UDP-N-acetylmuramoyl-L-alanyl-D-glutamate--2,6-diaminopimelate ligase [Actinotignum timonense]
MSDEFPLPQVRPVALREVSELPEVDGAGCEASQTTVTSVTADSRAVHEGALFAALPGAHAHGARFAPQAAQRGARAILTDAAGAALIAQAGVELPLLVVEDPAAHLGAIAARVYGEPAECLRSFAVTGTNGKTTTTYLLDGLLTALDRTTGLVGTVETKIADLCAPAHLTTPMPADLQALLALLVERGGTDVSMEVSSHALAQHRTSPVVFSVAGFTNLTRDHLDYHRTMENYYQAKRSLFTPECSRRAVITVDDEWGRRLAGETEVPTVALAVFSQLGGRSGYQVRNIEHGPVTSFILAHSDGWETTVRTGLPGDFNIANTALAVAMVLESGADRGAVGAVVGAGLTPQVPGRMEVVGSAPRVVVDFAHNTAALRLAINALRPTTSGQLIVVTGSAGERDVDKRPEMGRAVAELADVVYITDDDPHEEDPAPIRAALLDGARSAHSPARIVDIADRATAMRTAIREAAPEDTVLLAGRGHETYQPVAGGRNIPLDDREVARAALAERASSVGQGDCSGRTNRVALDKDTQEEKDTQ